MKGRLALPAVLIPFLLLLGCAMAPPEGAWLLVGSRAPDFSLPSEAGAEIALSSYRGRKNVVVVFSRAYR